LKVFASSYFVTSDLTNIDKLIEWLKLLEVEHVFTAKEVLYNKVIHNMLKIKLLKEGITSNVIESTNHNGVLLKTMSSRAGTMDMKKIDKVIDLTNSTPVEIK
jgi:hypothetical protein